MLNNAPLLALPGDTEKDIHPPRYLDTFSLFEETRNLEKTAQRDMKERTAK